MYERHRLVQILKSELAFLEQGGYRRGPRFPWRPNFIFEDSPTCIKVRPSGAAIPPCTECPLLRFVPKDRQETRVPCRHIPLTIQGETVNSFYETGTEEELETALEQWLRQTIGELETDERVLAHCA
jgi:hypothetical protein